ncbi:MAG: RNA polymerase Rpb4 family protein [Candidatus Micrarchaeota archaeon]|jgi:DNA-directed RNA polymerase subunit F
MIGKEQSEPEPISVVEALEILEERKKEGELGYEQQLAYEHAKKFAKLSKEDAEKLEKELIELGLGKRLAKKIIDIMPMNDLQLKQVLIFEKRSFDDSVIASIIEKINKYRK